MKTSANIRKLVVSVLLALAHGAWADATWKAVDGNWNDSNNWDGSFNASLNIENNAIFDGNAAGKTVTFTDLFSWGNYGVKDGLKLKNGIESPVVFTADADGHGFNSDNDSSYAKLYVGQGGTAGSLEIQKGTYLFPKGIDVGSNDGGASDGALTMRGGTLSGPVNIGAASGKTGTLNYYGGTISSFTIGATSGSTGVLNIYGDLDFTGNLVLGTSGKTGVYTQECGVVTVSGDIYVGDGATASSFTLNGGTNNAGRIVIPWAGSGTYSALVSGGKLNLSKTDDGIHLCRFGGTSTFELRGGEVVANRIWKETTSDGVTAVVIFNGGVLKPNANNTSNFMSAYSGMTVKVAEGGAIIDTDGYNVAIGAELTSGATMDGGLVKRGAGTLTIGTTPSYNGATKIEGGTLVMPSGYTYPGGLTVGAGTIYTYDSGTTYSGGIYLEEGAYLAVAATASTEITGVTVTGAGTVSDRIIVKTGDASKSGSATVSGSTISITVSETAATTTTWTGGGSDSNWSTADNWTHGVPSETIGAKFVVDSTVTFSDNTERKVKSIALNGKTVLLGNGNNDPKLAIGAFAENDAGMLVHNRMNIRNISGRALSFPAGVTNKILKLNGSNKTEFYNENNGPVILNGPLILEDEAIFQLTYSGASVLGPVIGAGNITTYGNGNDTFGGEWPDFTGTYTSGGHAPSFNAGFSATNATWNVTSGMTVNGDIALGTANVSSAITANSALTLTVCGGTFGAAVADDNVTLTKVGTGTLTFDGCTVPTVNVNAGTVAIGETMPTVTMLNFADGAIYQTTLVDDGNGGYTHTALTVPNASFAGNLLVAVENKELLARNETAFPILTVTGGLNLANDAVALTEQIAGNTSPFVWQPRVYGNTLKLRCYNPRAGLVIIFK